MRSRAALAALAVTALVAGCSGDGDAGGEAVAPTTTTAPPTTTTTVPPVTFTVTGTELVGGPGGALPADVAEAATGTAQRWLEAAVLTPLRSGAVSPDLQVVATPAVQERLAGPDRAALVDEAVAPPGPVVASRAELALTGLADDGGAVGVVVARFGLDLTSGTSLHLVREGELILVPTAAGWLVDGYGVSVTREAVAPPPPPPTTAPVAAPTTTAGS